MCLLTGWIHKMNNPLFKGLFFLSLRNKRRYL
nr:MAG TPA: hypothetical protein [Bacteriophage sp.]